MWICGQSRWCQTFPVLVGGKNQFKFQFPNLNCLDMGVFKRYWRKILNNLVNHVAVSLSANQNLYHHHHHQPCKVDFLYYCCMLIFVVVIDTNVTEQQKANTFHMVQSRTRPRGPVFKGHPIVFMIILDPYFGSYGPI